MRYSQVCEASPLSFRPPSYELKIPLELVNPCWQCLTEWSVPLYFRQCPACAVNARRRSCRDVSEVQRGGKKLIVELLRHRI